MYVIRISMFCVQGGSLPVSVSSFRRQTYDRKTTPGCDRHRNSSERSENPGCSISAAIDPLRLERAETVLRSRVWQMVRRGEIRMEREKHITKLYVVEGRDML